MERRRTTLESEKTRTVKCRSYLRREKREGRRDEVKCEGRQASIKGETGIVYRPIRLAVGAVGWLGGELSPP